MDKEKASERSFLEDIVAVYKKHNLSLSHEDKQGGFLVEPYSQSNVDWLFQALGCCRLEDD